MREKPILNACCGGRMFYFDKHDSRVLFQDIRKVKTILCDGRPFEVSPDVQADFTNMPYPDDSFSMVVFDPPHLVYSRGKKSKMVDGKMYSIARYRSSRAASSNTGIQIQQVMKTSRRQTSPLGGGKSTSSQEASLASPSARQESERERTTTATSGRRCYERYGRYSPLGSLVKTLLESS